jgi:hypothetical protein
MPNGSTHGSRELVDMLLRYRHVEGLRQDFSD